ncbi:hypothetical protein MYX76_06070 [Desulfobacterota bacterium AH_259_B03_O07]|nr:hypothetical protein [Desulfobacterota bacterium AH_259_B03_O07]
MNDRLDTLNDQLNKHISIITRCSVEIEKYGPVLLSSPPDKRYPYFYPRDINCASQLLRRLSVSDYDSSNQAFSLLKACAHFIKDFQREDGYWGQRYSLTGEDKSIYKQEDNVAHGIIICCNYLLASVERGEDVDELESFLHVINKALEFSISNIYKKELNLFYSTTSIHECALESGFTLWVNFSFLYAYSLAEEVANKLDDRNIISQVHLKFKGHFRYSIGKLFLWGDRYVRRFTSAGQVDTRPDFTLLTPFYYGFGSMNTIELKKSVSFLENKLWDPELGMIMRYLPFEGDFATHTHAGNGPWLQYTAILAQYHYWYGDPSRGDNLLELITKFTNEPNEIPEHLSTCRRFETFMEKEWQTGTDFEKEFHKEILLDDVTFDNILEEANNMRRAYTETERECFIINNSYSEGGHVHFCIPLMWSHVEFARALMIKEKDWWKILSEKDLWRTNK